jgi:hypothetical protein
MRIQIQIRNPVVRVRDRIGTKTSRIQNTGVKHGTMYSAPSPKQEETVKVSPQRKTHPNYQYLTLHAHKLTEAERGVAGMAVFLYNCQRGGVFSAHAT